MTNLIAVQLYTLQAECEKDFYGTLEKVAELGFNGVELAGYWGKEAEDLKATLDRLGLTAVSSHVPIEKMEDNLEAELEYLKTIDCKNIVCPYLLEDRRGDYLQLAKILNKVGERSQQEGILLSYHNHDFELEKSDGKSYLDILFAETNPEYVKAELDVYWLTLAGEDPLQWMEKYTGRIPLIHLKDMTTDDKRTFAELGTGGVNIEGVLKKSKEAKVQWLVVEQDKCNRSPFESIEISMKYLKETLPKIGKGLTPPTTI
ncbi:MAG: sugar phosphate isomerase/epimerase family protein [Bacillota bacterium]